MGIARRRRDPMSGRLGDGRGPMRGFASRLPINCEPMFCVLRGSGNPMTNRGSCFRRCVCDPNRACCNPVPELTLLTVPYIREYFYKKSNT